MKTKKSPEKVQLPFVSDYKGNPVLTLAVFPYVSFGVTKGKIILEHMDTIKRFVQEQERTNRNGS